MTLRIGVLGAARIAPKALLVPAAEIGAADTAAGGDPSVEVVAVAARDHSRAEAFAAEHDIPRVCDDYAALCHDPDIDAVYIALPASGHRAWSIEALRAGKDVLCEKPIALNAAEAAEMVAVASETGRLLVEAFHWRYHPLAARITELVETRLGTVTSADAEFTVPIPDRSDIRYQLELGGGALMDLGCYPVQWVRHVLTGDPTVVAATATEDPPGVDVTLAARFTFDDHRTELDGGAPGRAEIRCSMADDATRVARLVVTGTDGTLTVTNPLSPHDGNRVELVDASGESVLSESVDGQSTYHHQLLAFVEASRTRVAPITSGADSIANMAAIDGCYTAAGMQPRGTA